jgi:hypothetical protein
VTDTDTQFKLRASSETLDSPSVSLASPRAELPEALPVGSTPKKKEREDPGEPIGVREVAALIGCSVWTVRQRCMRQGLPHFRPSRTGRLIFYRNQVIRWLIENQIERRW